MENTWSVAKVNNNLRPMYVKEIIFEHTDETHYISVGEIIKILETSYGVTACRQTIYDDIEMLINAGFDIEDVNGKNNRHQYHVLSREFDAVELRIVIDAIGSLMFLPLSKSNSLIKKISRLAGPSADYLMKTTIIDDRPRTDNSQIYYIIDTLSSAIAQKKQVLFKYYEYLTSSKKVIKKKSEQFQVSPYRLVCCSDYYYLIGYSEQHEKITAFRVDCISGIPMIAKRNIVAEPEDLYSEKYIRESSSDKTPETTEVTLEFDSCYIDAMINRFGQNMDISYIRKTSCLAKVHVHVDNAFFAWIFGFDGKVTICGSREVREQYVRMVSKAMARL